MSISQERPTNPAKFFMKVKSGAVSYWDKDKQENVEVPTPFGFIVLDQLATIKGWSDDDNSGYWSNEVRSIGSDELTVRTSKGTKERGVWRDIKNSVGIIGSKYHSSIYIAHKSREGLVISNLSLTGAALKAWIEFTSKNRVNNVKVTLSEWADAKKGSVSYKVPVFTATPLTGEEKAEAVALDKELQNYLNEYFSYKPDDNHQKPDTNKKEDVVIEDIGEDPINMDDIPF